MNKQTQKQLLKEVGGRWADLARCCKVSRQAVQQWKNQGYIPDHHLRRVSKITGIPPDKLRRPLQ